MSNMVLDVIEVNPLETSTKYCFSQYYYYLAIKYILLNFLGLHIQRLFLHKGSNVISLQLDDEKLLDTLVEN